LIIIPLTSFSNPPEGDVVRHREGGIPPRASLA
jgi:hypothetical protein